MTNVCNILKKISGRKIRHSLIIKFVDELAYDIIEDTNQGGEEEEDIISVVIDFQSCDFISTLSANNIIQARAHIHVKLPGGR